MKIDKKLVVVLGMLAVGAIAFYLWGLDGLGSRFRQSAQTNRSQVAAAKHQYATMVRAHDEKGSVTDSTMKALEEIGIRELSTSLESDDPYVREIAVSAIAASGADDAKGTLSPRSHTTMQTFGLRP